jgi:adenine-specific DNA methylase
MNENDQECPRLIEVLMPIAEVSLESVRDKSLRHGHISTMHLWWARRPLAASRAIVFESLVYDPDDPRCPPAFRDKVRELLQDRVSPYLLYYTRKNRKVTGSGDSNGQDPYRPYDGTPDTLRNRLLMFVAKWSPEMIAYMKGDYPKPPSPSESLDDRCLSRWETSDPSNDQGREILRIAKELIAAAHGGTMPVVLDPFAGGGAIPLEAGRLGCEPIANDYNPVAYLILRATCEYPQKYGRPGKAMRTVPENGVSADRFMDVENVLSADVSYWANRVLDRARAKIDTFYPSGADGKTIVAYIWARTAPCSNPSCKGNIPLLRSLLLCDTPGKRVVLQLNVNHTAKTITPTLVRGTAITATDGTMVPKGRGAVRCPYCGQLTTVDDLKRSSLQGKFGQRMMAVVVNNPGGKQYRAPEQTDTDAWNNAVAASGVIVRPAEPMPVTYTQAMPSCTWGFTTWGSLFNSRQLVAMQTFVDEARRAVDEMAAVYPDREEYRQALATYLALWVSRVAQRGSSMGLWNTKREEMEHPFGRQAIPITWDYPEGHPFSGSTGGADGNIEWMTRVIEHESNKHPAARVLLGDAAQLDVDRTQVDSVVTDPPYFDAIAYADLSDYFYIWLKRCLEDEMPNVFATPLTPKSDEVTALKHRFGGDGKKANDHFRDRLAASLKKAGESLDDGGVVSVMFAHQSTEAWTALIEATFAAGLTVTATWSIDTELTTALKGKKSVLGSSVTVVCRKRTVGRVGSFRAMKSEIADEMRAAVKRFWDLGERGADLLVSCYGPAVGVFGRYERVERADGTVVTVEELLTLAKTAAMDAIAGDFHADTVSKLYYVWVNLYGISEQEYDHARLLAQIGGDAESALGMAKNGGTLVINGQKVRLSLLADRSSRRLGLDADAPLIDRLHRSMLFWKKEQAGDLAKYLDQNGLFDNDEFWRLAQSLFQTLPHEIEDWKLIRALLTDKQTLRLRAKSSHEEELFL